MLKDRLFPATVVFWNDAGIGGPDSDDGGFGGGYGGEGGHDVGIGSASSGSQGLGIGSGEGGSIAANDAGIISGLMEQGVDLGTLAGLSGGTGFAGGIGAADAGIVPALIEVAVLEPKKVLNTPLKAFFTGWKDLMGTGLGKVGVGLLSALGFEGIPATLGGVVAGKLAANAIGKVGERKAAQRAVVDALGFNPFGDFSKGFAMSKDAEQSDGAEARPFVSQEQGQKILQSLRHSGNDAVMQAIVRQLLTKGPSSLLEETIGGQDGKWAF